jgi:hypothetical protein
MDGLNFLKERYGNQPTGKNRPDGFHNAHEVARAALKGEASNGPEDQIRKYLDRLECLAVDPMYKQKTHVLGEDYRPRALFLLREMLMNKYVRPNKEKMAKGSARGEVFESQELQQRGEIAVTNLERSLDSWILHLSDANEAYPTWFRYYAFRNILGLGGFDKGKGEFIKRSKSSAGLFPDVDRGALTYVEQMIEATKESSILERLKRAQVIAANGEDIPQDELITKEKVVAFTKLSFAKQYAEGIRRNGEITPEMLKITEGKWVKYSQGEDPTVLWTSLQNKGTFWCTRGFATAKKQLQDGDFYVYYTLDKQGKPTIPRIAILMEGQNKISNNNVRGVLDYQQNMEGNMLKILETKLETFGQEADRFNKKMVDMKMLAAIENKIDNKQALTRDDLVFLYEIDFKIEGFGNKRNSSIEEIRNQRNSKKDASIIFNCEYEEVADGMEDINEGTKAYIGSWNIDVFQKIKNFPKIIHLYEIFPTKKIFMRYLETDSRIDSPEKAEKALRDKGIIITHWGKDLLSKTQFSQEKEKYLLVCFTVEQMGFPSGATTSEIYQRAQELKLELCPAQVGPHLRLQEESLEWMVIAMEQAVDLRYNLRIFRVDGGIEILGLGSSRAEPFTLWRAGDKFVFHFRRLGF